MTTRLSRLTRIVTMAVLLVLSLHVGPRYEAHALANDYMRAIKNMSQGPQVALWGNIAVECECVWSVTYLGGGYDSSSALLYKNYGLVATSPWTASGTQTGRWSITNPCGSYWQAGGNFTDPYGHRIEGWTDNYNDFC